MRGEIKKDSIGENAGLLAEYRTVCTYNYQILQYLPRLLQAGAEHRCTVPTLDQFDRIKHGRKWPAIYAYCMGYLPIGWKKIKIKSNPTFVLLRMITFFAGFQTNKQINEQKNSRHGSSDLI